MNLKKQLTVLALTLVVAVGRIDAAEPPPVDHYAALPLFRTMALSPDGTRIISLRAIHETYHAFLMDLSSGQSQLLVASDPDEFLFDSCRFANNERVVCRIISYITMRAGDSGVGPRRYRDGRVIASRLLAINVDRSNSIQLVPEARNSSPGQELEWNPADQSTVISWLPNDKEHILIQLARDDRLAPSVFRLNIYNNSLVRVRRHRDDVMRWYADDEGNILLATGARGDKPRAASLYDGWQWLELADEDLLAPPVPQGFAQDGRYLYVIGNNGENTRGVYRLDLKTTELELVYRNETYDVSRLTLSKATQRPLYATYLSDVPERHWFDEDLKARYEAVSASIPGSPDIVSIVSADRRAERFILHAEGNGLVPTYYFYDAQRKALVRISRTYRDLASVTKPRPVSFMARDGLEIPAYLLLPEGEAPFPTVLLPHGGPWSRDYAGFDPWAELLVSRGYAVLKPNFRGSSGYGREYMAKGFEQWGLGMQDDLIDGLDWMIEEGITDPDRVCIAGGSYGGYAALVAAYKTPGRFRCAVSFAGVTDLDGLAERWFNFRLGELSAARLPEGDARAASSPLSQVNKIGVPLLIVHGDKDRSVMIEQSQDLAQALKAAGKEHIYIEQANGDHYLSLQQHRSEFFRAMDEFLSLHLGASQANP